jgi:hypothetical protein
MGKLNDFERAVVVARVRKGESRTAVARDMGVSHQAVSKLCNNRIAVTAKEIVQEIRTDVERHALDDKDAIVNALLKSADALLDNFRRYDMEAKSTDKEGPLHAPGMSSGVLKDAKDILLAAAKLRGWLTDKTEVDSKVSQITEVVHRIVHSPDAVGQTK